MGYDSYTTDADLGPLFSFARSSDPQTSKQSAIDTSLVVAGMRAMFVEAVRNAGHATANEAASVYRNDPDSIHLSESVRKRASECLRLRLVRVVGTRACKVTGRSAQIYEVIE
jgi:hypothetical protein